jgi:hypothetical protein
MLGAYFVTDAALPLRGLYFYQAIPITKFEDWLLWPTRWLFPQEAIIWSQHFIGAIPATPNVAMHETWLLFACFILLFAFYLLALRVLPRHIHLRYLLWSTTLLGLLCAFNAAVMSQDVFSYIIYARMGIVYQLNPLTTLPSTIAHDPVYPFVYWDNQPSAYGPTWIVITYGLQWLASSWKGGSLLTAVLALRLFGLAMHLTSTWLIWLLSGSLQQASGRIAPYKRVLATLAFAWNPLLLIEAVLNVHNDAAILVLVLLAIWYVQTRPGHTNLAWIAAIMLALAACLKITMLVLFPGLLIFLWVQRPRRFQPIVWSLLAYVGTLVLLYAPFWDHGAALHVFRVNPGMTRDINGPYEFLTHLYESLRGQRFLYPGPDLGSTLEQASHSGAMVLYVLIYAVVSWRFLRTRQPNALFPFINWLAAIWLLYCLIGSPWLWPWYFITFLGLFALIEATDAYAPSLTRLFRLPLVVRLLSFALLGLYAFETWGPHMKYIAGLYSMEWMYVRGLWLCVVPLLALRVTTLQIKRGIEQAKRWMMVRKDAV